MRSWKAPLIAFLLVSTAVIGGPASQTAMANHECEFSDSLVFSIANSITAEAEETDDECELFHGRQNLNSSETDATQTKIDIYENGKTTRAQDDVLYTAYGNYLKDTQEVALMVGKNAYVRALNNGSTKSAALSAAKDAVSDYYATKQINLVKTWNNSVVNAEYLQEVARNETNVSYLFPSNVTFSYAGQYAQTDSDHYYYENYDRGVTVSLTTTNGSTVMAKTVHLIYTESADGTEHHNVTFTDFPVVIDTYNGGGGSGYNAHVSGARIDAPSNDYDWAKYANWSTLNDYWSKIETQENEVHAQLETFVNNTYDKYKEGSINDSELIDPYIAQRSYSPESGFQSWAALSLAELGANTPKNMDNVGNFTVVDDGYTYHGILLSDTNPDGGKFKANTTYNASNITGEQYVVTASQVHTLNASFRIEGITNADGEQVQNVTVRNITYETANLTRFHDMIKRLEETREEVEAMEQSLFGGGGSSGSITPTQMVIGGAALLALAYFMNDGGGHDKY